MKKILAFVLFAGLCTAVQAQNEFPNNGGQPNSSENARQKKTPEERATEQVERLTKKLSLTPEQQKQVFEITTKAMIEGEEMRKNVGGDRTVMREKRMAMMQATEAKIRAILNPDQAKQYDRFIAERNARMEERMKNRQNNMMGGGGNPPEMGGY